MTILQALESYYHRLPGVAEPGWSPEKFGWCIVLSRNGEVVEIANLNDTSGTKSRPSVHFVPASVKRTLGIAPNFLWDKTAYVLGRTAGKGRRTTQEHAAFVAMHRERLQGQEDEGLVALRKFLAGWRPEQLEKLPCYTAELLDANVMFSLVGDRYRLHERPAARALVAAAGSVGEGDGVMCLITGEIAPPARLHPTIKGVEGAQSSGAALVSFNLDAFTSLAKEQGENAPTSQAAAFRYGAALNHLLARDSRNRLLRPVGDATVVFWADASETQVAAAADAFFAQLSSIEVSDAEEAARLRDQLEEIAAGRPLAEVRPDLHPGTQYHVLGLSPNAARLSVRFWLSDTLEAFAQRLARHHADLAIEPRPQGWGAAPSVGRLLVNTITLQREYKNIPPLLAGEVMRAVLSGTRYPQSLLSATIIRLRARDSAALGWHAAVIRAVLARQNRKHPLIPEQGEVPMSLQRDHANPGYQLGRLFAVYEQAQRAALGKVNATIRDRFYGAASATPARIFPLIVRGGQSHLAKVRRDKPGLATLIEQELEEITGHFEPASGGIWPSSLRLQDQGEFAIGYYHQRAVNLSNITGDEVRVDDPPGATDDEGAE